MWWSSSASVIQSWWWNSRGPLWWWSAGSSSSTWSSADASTPPRLVGLGPLPEKPPPSWTSTRERSSLGPGGPHLVGASRRSIWLKRPRAGHSRSPSARSARRRSIARFDGGTLSPRPLSSLPVGPHLRTRSDSSALACVPPEPRLTCCVTCCLTCCADRPTPLCPFWDVMAGQTPRCLFVRSPLRR